MPWKKLSDVPKQVRTHKGAKLTLSQANFWGRVFDGSGRKGGVAWAAFDKQFKKQGGKFVARKTKKKK